jgi:hypothetical protein
MAVHVEDDDVWPAADLEILLQQFGLEPLDLEHWGMKAGEFARIVGKATDDVLTSLYGTVLDIPEDEARAAASVPDDHGLWNEGQVRVFLSHSAQFKDFIGDVARELAVVGVHGFVAHDTMKIEKPWQSQIEIALRTAEAFVGIIHEPVNASAWCQQEIGWAKGRGIPEYYIRMGANPQAFAGSTQWPSFDGRPAKDVAMDILGWLQRSTDLADRVVEGLVQSLHDATDYYSAEAAAKRIASFGGLTDRTWQAVDEAYLANDQVHGGVLPSRVLRPFYEENGRTFPPPRPEVAPDPWATPIESAPF